MPDLRLSVFICGFIRLLRAQPALGFIRTGFTLRAANFAFPAGCGRLSAVIGREILQDEEASANYRMRQVRGRRTGEVTWEVVESQSGVAVVTGLGDRDEALRLIRGWERLNARLEDGLEGHRRVH